MWYEDKFQKDSKCYLKKNKDKFSITKNMLFILHLNCLRES
jgi:hypothetical protein